MSAASDDGPADETRVPLARFGHPGLACGLTGIFHERLKVSVPCDIEIDLTAVDRRGR
ncbi:hypothetical protein ACIGDI_00290 [Streptomyces sp. NPDC085900]|uniref:hypothetical protein n=1 Tax=Streptomyces sp. NPDC085900 TaxID=3365737 RepID=UPI0037D07BC7